MTKEQVAGYVAVIDRVSAGGVVYLKQWLRWRNPADGIELTFNDYPIPTDWRPIFLGAGSGANGFLDRQRGSWSRGHREQHAPWTTEKDSRGKRAQGGQDGRRRAGPRPGDEDLRRV